MNNCNSNINGDDNNDNDYWDYNDNNNENGYDDEPDDYVEQGQLNNNECIATTRLFMYKYISKYEVIYCVLGHLMYELILIIRTITRRK